MASNGLNNRAKNGTCRVCQRVRNTERHLKAVGEVRHGFAVGHIWECTDAEECDMKALRELDSNIGIVKRSRIQRALDEGRYSEYRYFN